jgi:integrase
LAEARAQHDEVLKSVRGGENPTLAKQAARRKLDADRRATFEILADDFIDRYLYGPNKAKPHLKSAKAVADAIHRDLVPVWRKRPVTSIERADVVELLEAIVARGNPDVARLALAYGRKMYRWGINRGTYGLAHSPFDGISASELIGRPVKRTGALEDSRIRLLYRATVELGYPLGLFALLLLLSGQRLRELADARRRECDFANALWLIGCDRMKNNAANEVPLAPWACDLFRQAAEQVPEKDDVFIFRTTDGRRPISGFDKLKRRLLATMTKIKRRDLGVPEDDAALRKVLGLKSSASIPAEYTVELFIFHDLRRSMRTRLSALPIPYEIRERMIAHKRGGLDQIYDQHDFRDEKRRGFALWEQGLREIVELPPSNVVALPVAQ